MHPQAHRLQITEPGASPRVLIIEHEVEIGRECDGIIIEDPAASRRHAYLRPTDEGVVVTDLDSANGTLIEGVPITETMVILPGGRFEIGETEIVVHKAREGDQHVVTTKDIRPGELEAERASDLRKELSKSASRTVRTSSARRPPRG